MGEAEKAALCWKTGNSQEGILEQAVSAAIIAQNSWQTAVMDLHMLRFQCSKVHLSFTAS